METPPTKTRLAVAALFLALSVASAGRVYADAAPKWSDVQLVGFSDVIVRGRVTSIGVARDPRIAAPYTYVSLDVAEVLRGALPDRRIVLKQLGGDVGANALDVAGQPTFAVGEDVLVFLEVRPRDATLTTTAQWQGKFTIARAGNTMVAQRRDPQLMNRGVFTDDVRQLEPWLSQLRRASRATATSGEPTAIEFIPAEAARAIPAADVSGALTAATWRDSSGRRPAVRVDTVSPGQPGLADGGEGAVRRAADFWTTAALATLETGGLQPASCFIAREPDGRIAVGADTCAEMSRRGGTIALSGTWLRDVGTTPQIPARIVGAGVITNTGPIANHLLRSSSCFERLVAHELGHALGLLHAEDSGADATKGALLRCDGGFGTLDPSPTQHVTNLFSANTRTIPTALMPKLVPQSTTTPPATNVTFTRVSVASDGTQADDLSYWPSMSLDGRFVAFHSRASNLVPGTVRQLFGAPVDIFVHDRLTGVTTMENRGPDGVQATGENVLPSISGDGRFVAFQSTSTNLVPGVTGRHVYVRDRQLGSTSVASVSSSGAVANRTANEPVISADGRFISFYSEADNLVAGDMSGNFKVFTHDRVSGTTTLDCVSSNGTPANAVCWVPSLSGDGRYVAFESWATNLVPGLTRVFPRVYVRDRLMGVTTLESSATSSVDSGGRNPTISGDGRFVAFGGADYFLGSTVGLYLRDRQARQTAAILSESDSITSKPRVSADGRFVSYSRSSNRHVEVYDRSSGQFIDVGVGEAPTPVAASTIAFASDVPLVPDDSNRKLDIFVASPASGAPDSPTDLTHTLIGTTLALTWRAPVRGNPLTGYVIEAGTVPRGTDVASFSTGSTATSFAATVTGGGTLYIRVRSVNAAGVSGPSSEIIVGLAVLPTAPQGLGATVTGSTVTLTWLPPAAGAVTSYVVEAGSAPGASNLANFNSGTATNFVANGVQAGVYYVRVRAASFGGVGPPSNEVVVSVANSCVAPFAPAQLIALVSGSTVSLNWSPAAGASTYLLDVGSTPGGSDVLTTDLGSSTLGLTATGVGAATYFVRIRAANACGTSGPSNEATVVVR